MQQVLMRKNSDTAAIFWFRLQRALPDRPPRTGYVRANAAPFAVRVAREHVIRVTVTGGNRPALDIIRVLSRVSRTHAGRSSRYCVPECRNLLSIPFKVGLCVLLLRPPQNDSRRYYSKVDERQRQQTFQPKRHYRHNADAVTTHESK